MNLSARLRCLAVMILFGAAGCAAQAAQQETTDRETASKEFVDQQPKSTKGKTRSGASKMEEVYTPLVRITAQESKNQGLPAATIILDTGEQGLIGWKFAKQGEYLVLSGPPGAPLGLHITHVAQAPNNEADWKKLVEEQYRKRSPEPGSVGEIKLDDNPHAVFSFTSDKGPGRSHHLMTLFPIPKTKAGIVVDYFEAGDETPTPSPQAMFAKKDTAHVMKSLKIEFE